MILANFEQGMDRVFTASVHQWDYGQQLRITGLNLPPVAEVHFCVESDTSTITAVGVTTADHTDVDIPDGLLQQTELIKAYVYVADPEQGKTIRTVIIPVNARQKPQIPHSPEDAKLFRDAIQAVNESANRSAESEKQAKRWAIGEPVIAGSDIDNAKYYSEQAKADATKTDADKKAVAELVKKTANISQQVVEVEKLSKEVIDNALKVDADAKQVSTDKQAVDTAKQEVDAAKQAIDSAKTAVDNAKRAVDLQKQNIDNTVTDFGMLAQTGLDAINQAGTNNINAVNNEGKVQKQAVTDEGTVQKKAVTDTGTAEVGKVAAEGTKQLKSVQDAAAGIVADRQQIQKNATDVTTLREDFTKLGTSFNQHVNNHPSGGSGAVNPQDIEKAVNDYMVKNPVKVTETDPTVPQWAKEPTKPTYTASEVGALPSDTKIPTKLPNPNKLTFQGAVTAEYDGSGAVTVTIPQGGASGGTVDVERIEKLASDTTVELAENKLYIFPEMTSLTYSLKAPSKANVANEYHFVFKSGASATQLVHAVGVNVGAFKVEPNKIYEISIMENLLTSQSWAVV